MVNEELENEDDEMPADFETAIETCGFGMFNIFLLLAALPGLWGTVFEIATMSYVFPAAECDLDISLIQKGLLNAITFGGTLITAIPWGFVADTYSRKYVLIYGLVAEGTVTLLSSLSQTTDQLILYKFLGGVILCGPVAGFISYITEFHGVKTRTYIVIIIGFINAMPFFVLPLLARSIIPLKKNYNIWIIKFNSWQLLIALTALPSLLSGFLLMMFPESPKFLMSQGRGNEAMEVFQIIYAINNMRLRKSYPITTLVNESPKKSLRRSRLKKRNIINNSFKDLVETFNEGLHEFQSLCTKHYMTITLMVCSMQFFLVMSANTIGLWQPQTSEISEEMLEKGYNHLDTCTILAYSLNRTEFVHRKPHPKCVVHIKKSAYKDNIIIGAALCLSYVMAMLIVHFTGNSILLRVYLIIASLSQFFKYWSPSRETSIMLASINTSSNFMSLTLLLNASVNLYPTSIRTMAVIFLMCWGRLGGLLGNLLFPLLMSLHCIAVFVFYSLTYICTFTISFFVKNTTMESLK